MRLCVCVCVCVCMHVHFNKIVFLLHTLQFKCHDNNREASMSDVAKSVLSKMNTRKFITLSTDVDACAICLEDYREGQVCKQEGVCISIETSQLFKQNPMAFLTLVIYTATEYA